MICVPLKLNVMERNLVALQCQQKTLRPNLILSKNRIKITYIIFYLLDNDTLIFSHFTFVFNDWSESFRHTF